MECKRGLAMRFLSVRLSVKHLLVVYSLSQLRFDNCLIKEMMMMMMMMILTKRKKNLSRFLYHTKDHVV